MMNMSNGQKQDKKMEYAIGSLSKTVAEMAEQKAISEAIATEKSIELNQALHEKQALEKKVKELEEELLQEKAKTAGPIKKEDKGGDEK
jgi:hypothetical protein